MNAREVAVIAAYIATNWPSIPMSKERTKIYAMELGDLDFNVVQAVLRGDFAAEPFPPTPMMLRKRVVEGLGPRPLGWDEAYGELMDKIAAVGYASPEPEWSHPALHRWVGANGGWTQVCQTTPARGGFDAQSMGVANTFRAQFRDAWKAHAVRAEREQMHAALSHGGTPERPELEE